MLLDLLINCRSTRYAELKRGLSQTQKQTQKGIKSRAMHSISSGTYAIFNNCKPSYLGQGCNYEDPIMPRLLIEHPIMHLPTNHYNYDIAMEYPCCT